jgi:DNA repair protein RadA/Sms
MKIANSQIEILGDAHALDNVIARADEVKPTLLVVDSLQCVTCSSSNGAEGSASASEACTHLLQSWAMRTGTVVWILNHMKKDKSDAVGSETVGHVVDAVFFLDSVVDEDEALRVLHAPEKNRTASTRERAFFRMGDDGRLVPVRRSRLEVVRS